VCLKKPTDLEWSSKPFHLEIIHNNKYPLIEMLEKGILEKEILEKENLLIGYQEIGYQEIEYL
jgi:hypothetical protein